jgi:hypothetical protein
MFRRLLIPTLCACGALFLWAAAPAENVRIYPDDSQNIQTEILSLSLVSVVPVSIPASTRARDKAVLIEQALDAAGMPSDTVRERGQTYVRAFGLPPAMPASMAIGGTQERSDKLVPEAPLFQPFVLSARIVFGPGHFEPYESGNRVAYFTAGIVTDVGELSAQVSARQLDFAADGPIICQALFQRLAPRAPQYGAQINYAGDRLDIYFDPAYTVTQGGIIFGTSSPTPGSEGIIQPRENHAGPLTAAPGDYVKACRIAASIVGAGLIL